MTLSLAAGLPGGCSSPRVMPEKPVIREFGRDGWRKARTDQDWVEAVRNIERVVIRPGETTDSFIVTINPKRVPFPTPWNALPVVGFQPAGLHGEHRVYRIPEGRAWTDVRDWYVAWFDFRAGPDLPATEPTILPIPGIDDIQR
jgi:hypothetical protein